MSRLLRVSNLKPLLAATPTSNKKVYELRLQNITSLGYICQPLFAFQLAHKRTTFQGGFYLVEENLIATLGRIVNTWIVTVHLKSVSNWVVHVFNSSTIDQHDQINNLLKLNCSRYITVQFSLAIMSSKLQSLLKVPN